MKPINQIVQVALEVRESKMLENCLICERITMIKNGTNPYFVRELETGYVVIGDSQHFRGYTLFLAKVHVTELHYFEKSFKLKYLEEMSLVEEAVAKVFNAEKMNLEMLGNGDTHVHWHLFPRRQGDLLPYAEKGPVWWRPFDAPDTELSREELKEMASSLGAELDRVIK
jgi:diadenosine tetraphosphate (Ap4A) HIT family hydrolase